ncbi:hypothetical protein niasHT_013367 [Heterodera trifolii]|uniref:Major sperm protein n=1 Tax=Heterodera trifolii TaxID=157864 RepID=A0ABD2L9B8_9BILA
MLGPKRVGPKREGPTDGFRYQQHFKQRSQRSHIKHSQSQPDKSDNNSNAQLPPENIATIPTQKIVFNAPFDNGRTAWVEVFNTGTKRIGDAIKTTKPQRINVNPPNGVLGPKKRVRVAISCEAFDPGSEETEGDRVTVQWTNTPDPDANVFKPEWFQGDGMVRRKNLPIEYNIR